MAWCDPIQTRGDEETTLTTCGWGGGGKPQVTVEIIEQLLNPLQPLADNDQTVSELGGARVRSCRVMRTTPVEAERKSSPRKLGQQSCSAQTTAHPSTRQGTQGNHSNSRRIGGGVAAPTAGKKPSTPRQKTRQCRYWPTAQECAPLQR